MSYSLFSDYSFAFVWLCDDAEQVQYRTSLCQGFRLYVNITACLEEHFYYISKDLTKTPSKLPEI